MPRRTRVTYKTKSGNNTFFKPAKKYRLGIEIPKQTCAECERQKAEEKGNANLRAIGLILILGLMLFYGLVMFGMGYLLRDSICNGMLVMR